jgi:hypothetical protein
VCACLGTSGRAILTKVAQVYYPHLKNVMPSHLLAISDVLLSK